PNGDFLTIGLLSGEQINWRDIVHYNSIKANLFHLRHWNASVTPEKWQSTFKQIRSEEHTSELQSRFDIVCRLLLEKKKIDIIHNYNFSNPYAATPNLYTLSLHDALPIYRMGIF